MAKVKPATSRKVVKPKDQVVETAADEITTALDRLSEHLSKHLQKYLIALVGICIAAFGVNMLLESRAEAAVERSDAASAVLSATTDSAAVWTEKETLAGIPGLTPPAAADEKEPVKADHADTAAQLAAIEKAAEEASATVKDEASAVIALVQSSTAFQKGDLDAAGTAYDAAVASLGDSPSLQPILLEKKGKLAEAKGDTETAVSAYTELTTNSDTYFKVRGFLLLGDLKAATDKAAAKAAYASALEQLTPGEGQLLPQSLRSLRSEITRRHAQL